MGSYADLNVNHRRILTMGSYVSGSVASLFNERDKKVFELRSDECDDDVDPHKVCYITTAGKASERLNLFGFDPNEAIGLVREEIFRDRLEESGIERPEDMDQDRRAKLEILRGLSDKELASLISGGYEFMKSSWKEDDNGNLQVVAMQQLLDSAFEWGELLSDRHILSIILFSLPPDTEVELDITAVVSAGYYGDNDRVVEVEADVLKEKILVLTEGSSDTRIIQQAMAIHRPHLSDCFAFLDYDSLNPKGGAVALAEMIKAFAASGTATRILGIFDNDSAAHEAAQILDKIRLPSWVKYLYLPYIYTASSYPTVGPQGAGIDMDINGSAVSIELFACTDILKKNGKLRPIIWGGYMSRLGQYQGEVSEKSEISMSQMLRQRKVIEGSLQVNDFNWGEMPTLLDSIIINGCQLKY